MKYFVINAFTDTLFGGNPAGVCVLEKPLEDELMQNIAAQNNLAETAFIIQTADGYSLRWFTPEVEIDLCGHATLAAAFVLMNYYETTRPRVDFTTLSGRLSVLKENDLYIMDFPSRNPAPLKTPPILEKALNARVVETHAARDLMAVLESEDAVLNLKPDLALLSKIEAFAVIVTARGENCDFVSRFFAPNAGIPEDPVTGSSHCTLIPFWSKRLGKNKMTARQLSRRGGTLYCEYCNDRVKIAGKAVCYSIGEILI